jgi:Tfp pilus assembly protein PilF
VDAARTALRRGDGERTLRLLSDYEHRFAPVHLEPEVLYLRMQAAKLQGDRAGARRAATQIVTQFPQSPEVGRAEELLSSNGDTAKK